MDAVITWEKLSFIVAAIVASNGITGYLVYRTCQALGRIEQRLTVIETRMGEPK